MKADTLAYLAFAAVFLTCTVVFLAFVLVGWLGWVLGLLWAAAVLPFALLVLWQLYVFANVGEKEFPKAAHRGRK